MVGGVGAYDPQPLDDSLLDQIPERRLKLKEAATSGRDKKSNEKAVGVMRDVVTRLNLLRSKHADGISKKLAQAGWRSHDAMVAYLFTKATLPLAAAGSSDLSRVSARVSDWTS